MSIAALGSFGLLLAPGPFSAPLIALLYPCLLGIALVRVGWR